MVSVSSQLYDCLVVNDEYRWEFRRTFVEGAMDAGSDWSHANDIVDLVMSDGDHFTEMYINAVEDDPNSHDFFRWYSGDCQEDLESNDK